MKVKVISQYHTPGCPNYVKRAKNAIFITPANSPEHEHKKLDVCYGLRKLGVDFITEAVRNTKLPGRPQQLDVINIKTGDEIQIIHKHENHYEVYNYRKWGIVPIFVNGFLCEKCKLEYPVRNKKKICKVCEEVQNGL